MDLSIGQMARINHISIQTLRLYDKMGLLKPVAVDAGSGYRYYSILQCAKLDLIGSLKQCGLSLKEIGSYFENGNIESLEGELRNTLDQIGTEMRRLSEQKEAVKRTLESFEQYRVAPPAGTITLEYIPRRSIIVLDSGNNYFEEGLEFYEHSLLQLKHALADRNVEHIYYRNPGTIWRKDKVMKREFVSTEVYVRADAERFRPDEITEIPAGMYQCIYCSSSDTEKELACKLLDQVEKNGYTIAGDYLCETIVETPIFEKDERGMFLRLQVPVNVR